MVQRESQSPFVGMPESARFSTTHWSVVLHVGGSPNQANEALEKLCKTYWVPIYVQVRRSGYGPEDAQDVTQEFLADLLVRGDLARLNPARGKFRWFLLAALKHFLSKDRRDRNTLKRGGGFEFLPLQGPQAEDRLSNALSSGVDLEKHFDRYWAFAIVEEAMTRLRKEWMNLEKPELFDSLKVFISEPPSDGAYDEIAGQLGLGPNAVATAVHRLRRRFREIVRETVAQTVSTPLELEEELGYLLDVLSSDPSTD